MDQNSCLHNFKATKNNSKFFLLNIKATQNSYRMQSCVMNHG